MKKLVLIISSLITGICSFSQETSAAKIGAVKKNPMRDAGVYKLDQFVSVEFESPSVTVVSKVDSFFSFCNAKVDSVVALKKGCIVIIIDENKKLFSFISFSKVCVQKNIQIKKGELIGLANKDENNNFSVIKTASTKKSKRLNEDQIWQLIKDE